MRAFKIKRRTGWLQSWNKLARFATAVVSGWLKEPLGVQARKRRGREEEGERPGYMSWCGKRLEEFLRAPGECEYRARLSCIIFVIAFY